MAAAQDAPQEMRDLLIRLDTKVDGISSKLDRMEARADGHEQRIQKIETELATRPSYIQRFEHAESELEKLGKLVDRMITTVDIVKYAVGVLGLGGIGALIKVAVTGSI